MRRVAFAALGVWALALAAQAPSAAAAEEIKSFSFKPSATQAGGHPDISIDFEMGSKPVRPAARVTFDWPAGTNVLKPAVPLCGMAEFGLEECSSDSQVGLVDLHEEGAGGEEAIGTFPVFALEPAETGDFARVGFSVPGFAEPIYGDLYTGSGFPDYAVSLTLSEFPSDPSLSSLDLDLWGVPASPWNDAARFPTGTNGCPGVDGVSCNTSPVASNVAPAPQIENPTICFERRTATAILATYGDEGQLEQETVGTPTATGCDLISFSPSVSMVLTTTDARSPTGLELELAVPQSQNPDTPGPSELRGAEVVFEGGVFPRFGAEGLGICLEQMLGIYNNCPPDSRLGPASIESPLWPGPLSGSVYLGGENEEGFLAYLIAGGYGYHLILPFSIVEEVEEDGTEVGAIAFESLPELPIAKIAFDLPANTELLETANACGVFKSKTYFEPWDTDLSTVSEIDEQAFSSGPEGAPCPVPATSVAVGLSPASLPADGSSSTTVTAQVTGAGGKPVIGDIVEFGSSDRDERLGPVSETAPGLYSATVTVSTHPGPVTITAVDDSVRPGVGGTATLQQVAPSPAEREAAPRARFVRHPRARSRVRRPSFAFAADQAGATFRCSVDTKPYEPCTSPLRLKKLSLGSHRLRVLALGAAGQSGEPAVFHFRILAAKPKRKTKR